MTSKEPTPPEAGTSLKPGLASNLHTFYLFKEKTAKTAYNEFALLLEKGYEGLCISRSPPHLFHDRFKTGQYTLLWLTGNKVPEQNTLAPNEISRLAALLSKFLSPTGNEPDTKGAPLKNRVILIDNLEYLIIQNNFQIILRVLHMVRDKIMLYPAIMLIPVDPLTFDFRELRLIERECEVIDVKDY